MDTIRADSSQELLNILGQMDISVPLRTEGRTDEHCERWSICRFLASFADSALLQFPLTLVHRDRPDFLLEMGQSAVGIEVTEAVPENAAAIDAYRENKEVDGPFFLKRHLPGDSRLSGVDLRRKACANDPGDGWVGDSVEHEWAAVIKWFVERKVERSHQPNFDQFERNWLLIYDNWPLPALDQDRAVKKLSESVAAEEYGPFDNVLIESSKQIWILTRDGHYSRPIQDLWPSS